MEGKRKKILVVDDDAVTLKILNERLSVEGYEIVQASDGHGAIKEAKRSLPDLIIMDILLPDIEGSETVRLIKEMNELKDTEVIFLSGIISSEGGAVGQSEVKVGSDLYPAVGKPIKFAELIPKIRHALR